jgi:peptide/nickel transport system substrate-binding protein
LHAFHCSLFTVHCSLIAAAALLIATLSACLSSAPPATDVLRIGIEGNPTNLDPRFAADAYSTRIVALVYEGLLTDTPDGGVAPLLAASWTQPDDRTYRFTLRPDAVWQDGAPVTAADVAATYRFLADPKNACPAQETFGRVERIETPDDRTVVLRLNEPYSSFVVRMSQPIVPARLQDPAQLAAEPLGSGPYRLTEFRRGEKAVLTANEHWRGGAPAIRRLEFCVAANDATRLLRLTKGELDMLQNCTPPYALKFVAQLRGRTVLRAPGVNYSYFGFNLNDPHGIASNPKVRQALAYAIDREQIIRTLLYGQARPATGLLAPENWAYEPDVRQYPYDPARARQLLDEAGFPQPAGGGVRFTLSYKTSTDKLRLRIAEVIANQLAAVGVGFDRRSLEWGAFFDDIKQGNFQTYTASWVGVTDPDHLYYAFHSSMVPPRGANRNRYANADVDRWLEAARRTSDRDERRRLYGLAQKQLAEDCAYISLWWADNVAVVPEQLHNFSLRPSGDFRNLAQARLER